MPNVFGIWHGLERVQTRIWHLAKPRTPWYRGVGRLRTHAYSHLSFGVASDDLECIQTRIRYSMRRQAQPGMSPNTFDQYEANVFGIRCGLKRLGTYTDSHLVFGTVTDALEPRC